jgi:hypothetical protein
MDNVQGQMTERDRLLSYDERVAGMEIMMMLKAQKQTIRQYV